MAGQCHKGCPFITWTWKMINTTYINIWLKIFEGSNEKIYILDVDVGCSKELQKLHCDPPSWYERIKIDKCQKL